MLKVIAKAISVSRAGVILIAFLVAIAAVVESSQPFQECVKEIYYNPATENFEKSIASFSAEIGIHRDCFGDFTHDNAEAIIAAFTIILSFPTIFLWFATRDLVRGAEKTAKRQLRAYVFIHQGDIRLENDTVIMANITLKNFGATPGYDFKSWTNIRIGNPGEPIFGQRKSPAQTSIIGPFSDISATSQIIPITPDERTAINNGIKEIFVWGEAAYTDAFGARWTFLFKATNGGLEVTTTENITGRLLWRGWRLSPAGYEEKKS